MRKKVFQHAGALIIAAIILTFFTMSWAMYNNTAEQLRVSVRNECEYYRYFLDKMGDDSLDKPAGKITASRVTLIDTDGTVLFDSVEDAKMMGNHSGTLLPQSSSDYCSSRVLLCCIPADGGS